MIFFVLDLDTRLLVLANHCKRQPGLFTCTGKAQVVCILRERRGEADVQLRSVRSRLLQNNLLADDLTDGDCLPVAVSVAMAVDLKKDGVTVISLCPGWVATDMGATAADTLGIDKPSLDAPTSVSCQLKVIDGLTLEKSGTFFNHEGNVVPY